MGGIDVEFSVGEDVGVGDSVGVDVEVGEGGVGVSVGRALPPSQSNRSWASYSASSHPVEKRDKSSMREPEKEVWAETAITIPPTIKNRIKCFDAVIGFSDKARSCLS